MPLPHENCSNCDFCFTPHPDSWSECRRHAPRPGESDLVGIANIPSIKAVFPIVQLDHWCGEFQDRRGDQKGVGGGIPARPSQEEKLTVISG